MSKQAFVIIEVDVDYCSLTYGVAPCTASLGLTGSKKCFNSAKTCQDRANFDPAPLTLRYCSPFDPYDNGAIPCVTSVDFTPQVVRPGEDIGERASVHVSFRDFPHNDIGLDKYRSERSYDPLAQGSYWSKFKARFPYIKGRPFRLITGFVDGGTISNLETRNFVVESGTLGDNSFAIVGKDVLKLTNGDKAQAPVASQGSLLATLLAGETTFTLTPSGIGADYPASGEATIGGNEYVTYMRSGDDITLTARGLYGTEDRDHDPDELFQAALVYSGQSAADIIYDLLTTYANIPASWIDLPTWQDETSTEIGRVYSARIATPTAVDKLVNELIEQVGLVLWVDEVNSSIGLRSLRPIDTGASGWTGDNIIAGSLNTKEQPNRHYTQIWTFFAKYNPTEKDDKETNYLSVQVTDDPTAEEDHGGPSIKKIYSRWIPLGNRAAAIDLNAALLTRFRDPPRLINFILRRDDSEQPNLGSGYNLLHRVLQDDEGAQVATAVHLTNVEPSLDVFNVQGEEFTFFAQGEGTIRWIILDTDVLNVNLRDVHDSFYSAPDGDTVVKVLIQSGVVIGSATNSSPAFDVGDWPTGATIEIYIQSGAYIAGGGGPGGHGGDALHDAPFYTAATDGGDGGIGFYTRFPVSVYNGGTIGGGAGGGGGGAPMSGTFYVDDPTAPGTNVLPQYGGWFGGSGGGAGASFANKGVHGSKFASYAFGSDGKDGENADDLTPGAPGPDPDTVADCHGGAGGDAGANLGDAGSPGEAGTYSVWFGHGAVGPVIQPPYGWDQYGAGGAAGDAIDGISYVDFIDSGGDPSSDVGTILGNTVN